MTSWECKAMRKTGHGGSCGGALGGACVYAPFPTQRPVSWRSAGDCDIKEDAAGHTESHFRRQLRKSFVVVLSLVLPFSFLFSLWRVA